MFQFGTSEQNGEITYFNNGFTEYVYRQDNTSEQQRTLQTLKVQTDYLVTEINGIKDVLGEFIGEVRDRLNNLTDNVSQLQRVSQGERPKKKFKKAVNCPHDDCPRRYSSKIALNCHIRTKHRITKPTE